MWMNGTPKGRTRSARSGWLAITMAKIVRPVRRRHHDPLRVRLPRATIPPELARWQLSVILVVGSDHDCRLASNVTGDITLKKLITDPLVVPEATPRWHSGSPELMHASPNI
jgi:hypothetical protein